MHYLHTGEEEALLVVGKDDSVLTGVCRMGDGLQVGARRTPNLDWLVPLDCGAYVESSTQQQTGEQGLGKS